jgi:hypothetical protein
VEDDIPVDSETLLVVDFMNLKIKPVQSFRDAHRGRMYVYVYRSECSYMYKYLYLYCVSKKNLHCTTMVFPIQDPTCNRFTCVFLIAPGLIAERP